MNTKLIQAVRNQFGKVDNLQETIQDVVNHGMTEGISGWIYYDETSRFFVDNKKEILEFLKELAEDWGMDLLEVVGSFSGLENFGHFPIAQALLTDTETLDREVVQQLLCWAVAEAACREILDELEEQE